MGGHLQAQIAAWTLLCFVRVAIGDSDLLQDLGLDVLPDLAKINISHYEYTNMMELYLRQLEKSADASAIPKLLTFDSERRDRRLRRCHATTRLRFPVNFTSPALDVQHSEIRILVPPVPGYKSVRVFLYEVLGGRRRKLVADHDIFLSPKLNKWSELDVTNVVQSWLDGKRNLGLELECPSCERTWAPSEASITALVHPRSSRERRSLARSREIGKTDCRGSKKKRCCRHTMEVNFKDLDISQDHIIQPKSYEAGFCRGHCPLNYNHATNHSRIQSLVHKIDKKAMPKVCCAPSKLEPLEILRINPYDTNKLMIQKWDNMRVLECACS